MSAFCLVLGNNFTRIPRHEAEVISKKTNGRINQDKSIDDQNLKEASFGQFCSKRNSLSNDSSCKKCLQLCVMIKSLIKVMN